jgi:hypothetical protein
MDVVKVDQDIAYVVSVSDVHCKSLFKIFHMFQTYIASVLSECCICYIGYVASVCSKYFICFSRMLELFHLSIEKSRSRCRVIELGRES